MYNKRFVQAYQMAPTYIPNSLAEKPTSVRTSLGSVDRDMANVETEGGETVFLPDKDGLPAHYKIHGPRHHQGGVPMNIPPDSFVFSDTASMRIKDPDLQKEFGMAVKKKGYTPAEIAAKYDINKFRKVLYDPNSDRLQVETAEQNIANFQVKLGKLALVQESMKGFPGGIPLIAMPYLAKYNISPEMILPVELGQRQQGMPMDQMPMARYGGDLMQFQGKRGSGQVPAGTQAATEEELSFLPNVRRKKRLEKRARRQAERDYMVQLYLAAINDIVSTTTSSKDEKPDLSTGTFLKYDSSGNPYYVDGRGIRIKSFDSAYYGPNGTPTTKDGEKIIERNGKRYRVTTKTVSAPKVDPTKVKDKKDAVSAGDIYMENGKYYQIGKYDETKPIRATKSGQQIDPAKFDENKTKALEILKRLEKDGAAVYHPTPFKVGNETRDPGWEIKPNARGKMNTEEKEFLTDFFSVGKEKGQIGAGTPELSVSLQGSGDSGFYGYTNSDFYEYRFWKARNQDRGAADWDTLPENEKVANRKNMLYNLGFDIDDPHISANIDKPDKLYTKDFISGKKAAKLNRAIKDKDGNEYNNLGFADAIESYFTDEDFRPGLQSDKKLGLEHADAFTYDKPITEVPNEDKLETVEEEVVDKYTPEYVSSGKYAPWWLQDVVQMSGALQDLYSIKKYTPYKPTYSPFVPRPTFYDPNREIAAIQETAGMAADATRGMRGSAQALGSRLAALQGTAAESIANTMGRYNNLNVGVANEFAYKQADILNEANMKNQAFMKTYIDEFNTVNQNFDNSKRALRNNLRQSYINAITNRAQAQVLNELYPNFQIDPMTGGFLSFYDGERMIADENAGQTSAMLNNANAFYKWWKEDHPDLSEDSATSIWSATTRMKPQATSSAAQNYYNAYQNVIPNAPVNTDAADNYSLEGFRRGGMLPFSYTVGYMR
jgi:hypothetical protein